MSDEIKGVTPPFLHIKACFTGLGEFRSMFEKSTIKPSAAPEEAACNLFNSSSDVTQRSSCIVGNVGRAVHWPLLDSSWAV